MKHYCSPHNKEITHFGYQDDALKGMCGICIENFLDYKTRAEEVYDQVGKLKDAMIKNVNNQSQANQGQLVELIATLNSASQQLKDEIDKNTKATSEQIENQIIKIQKQTQIIANNINNFDSFDKKILIDFFYKQTKFDHLKVKNLIKKCLENFQSKLTISPIFEQLHLYPILQQPYGIENKRTLFCEVHKEKIVKVQMNSDFPKKRLYCQRCQEEEGQAQLQPIEQINSKFDLQQQYLVQSCLEHQKLISSAIKKIKMNQIELQENNTITFSKFMMKLEDVELFEKEKIQNLIKQVYQYQLKTNQDFINVRHYDLVNKKLQEGFLALNKEVQTQNDHSQILKTMKKTLLDLQNLCSYKIFEQLNQPEIQQKEKKTIKYELVQQKQLPKGDWCNAIAINKQKNIILVALNKDIISYKFDQNALSEETKIQGHKKRVTCLAFMNHSKSFISSSWDEEIKIWQYQGTWTCWQNLPFHKAQVQSLIINSQDNQIISGGCDKSLQFFMKNNHNNIWAQGQVFELEEKIHAISLNNDENKLIVCLDNKLLKVLVKEPSQKWDIKQTIKTAEQGYRVCFIKNHLFSFQQSLKQLEIFQYQNEKAQFCSKWKYKDCLKQQISEVFLFPSQFIKQKQLLVNKDGGYIYIFQLESNEELNLIETIKFNSSDLYGVVSDDGQYLISWDRESEKLQIREYQEKVHQIFVSST